jgi:hypothetical protein
MGEVFLLSVFLRLLSRLSRKIWISRLLHMLPLRDSANMATPPKGRGGKPKLPGMPKDPRKTIPGKPGSGKSSNFLPKQTIKTRKKAY